MLRRRLAAALFTVALCLGLVLPGGVAAASGASPARADLEVDQVDLINQERATRGLGEVRMHALLTRLAREHSRVMADEASGQGRCGDGRTLRHRSPLADGITVRWRRLTENVACNSDTRSGEAVHRAFMNSSGHRANILDGGVDLVGVGTHLDSGGVLWTTQIFMRADGVEPEAAVLREGTLASGSTFGDDAAELVVVGRADTFPDLLGGAALAGGRGPVLFTDPPSGADGDPVLNPRTMAELDRVLPAGGRVYLVGGPAAVSVATEDELRGNGYDVVRLEGADRHATARVIAEAVAAREGAPDTILVANARSWPDAITGGNAGGIMGLPVVLVEVDRVPDATRAFLAAHPGARRVVLGGSSVVSDAVVRDLGAERVAGRNRIHTSIRIADRFFPSARGKLVVGYGWGDDDWGPALAWSGRSINEGTPQVLVSPDVRRNEPELAAWLQANRGRFDDVVFSSAVPSSVRAEVASLLGL